MTRAPETDVFVADLELAKGGDEHALERILKRVEKRLGAFLDDRLGRNLRAKLRNSDVMQETYMTMLRLLPDFESRSENDFVIWVFHIIDNEIRRQHRWFRAKKRAEPKRVTYSDTWSRIVLRDQASPSQEVHRQETRALLARALERLEPDYRQVIELSVLEDLPHTAVAARMKRSPGAVRMLLSRARAALSLELRRLDRETGVPQTPDGECP